MTDWFKLAAMVDRQMDRSWSEPVRVSNFVGAVASPDNPPKDIRAILETFDGSASDLDGGNAQSWQTRLSAGRARLRIHRDTYPDIVVAIGDAVCALTRRGRPWFTVLEVNDRDDTHLVLELGEQ